MNAEYWVLKVLDPASITQLTPAMISELEMVGGELCEPIDSYREQDVARLRAIAEHQRTGRVHKVVMSVPVDAI